MHTYFFKQTSLLFLAAFGIAVFGLFFSLNIFADTEGTCLDGYVMDYENRRCIKQDSWCDSCIYGCDLVNGSCLQPTPTPRKYSEEIGEFTNSEIDSRQQQTNPNTGSANTATGTGDGCKVVCGGCSPGFSSLVCNGSIVESCTPDTSGLCGEAENTPSEQGGQEYNLFPTQSLQDTEDSSSDNCKVGGTMCGTCPESIRGNDRAKKFYQQYHNMLYGTFPPCDGQTQEQNPPATPLPIEPAESQEDSSTVITPTSKPVHIVVTPTDVPSVNSGWFPPAEY